jgi:hypothetical protein
MRRIRFSLRFAFAVTTIVACGCYWLMLPTINAQRFVAAVRANDYEAADSFFLRADDRFFVQRNEDCWEFHPRADLLPLSWHDIWSGHRQIHLTVVFGKPGRMMAHEAVVRATRSGLESPQLKSMSGGGMGIAGD